MTPAGAGRRREGGVPATDEDGPDPAEDPILYLSDEGRGETKEDEE